MNIQEETNLITNKVKREEIKKRITFGDVATISKETGFSGTTVRKALNGEIGTRASRIVIAYAEIIVKQKDARVKLLKEVIQHDA